MKHTLRSKVLDMVQPYLNEDGLMAPGSYGAAVKGIHTDVVSDVVDSLSSNRILNAQAPPIDPCEKFLPRQTRCFLSQLRSGHCARLKDYMFRLGRVDDDICAECHGATQSVAHIFDCPSHPTTLTLSDLWAKPWDTAVYLQSLPSFNFLPCPGPPPPPRWRPRRRRPPDPPPIGGQ